MLSIVIYMRTQSRIIIFHGKTVRPSHFPRTVIGAASSNDGKQKECTEEYAAHIQSSHHTILSKKRPNECTTISIHQKSQLADKETVRGMPKAIELPEAYQ